MNEPRASAKALAIAAVESEHGEDADRRVLTKLHAALGKLVGSHGIDVLLRRALRLAQKTEPKLASATIGSHGALQGLSEVEQNQQNATTAPLVALLSHVFELLIRFIGEDLTNRVIGDIWPSAAAATGLRETKR